jgi:DNA-binding CsgD family transcriptional regulator
MSRPSHYSSRYKNELSPQQQRVVELIAAGKTNAEISQALGLSLDGAKWHVREVLAKLDVGTREEAAEWWRQCRRPAARMARGLSVLTGPLIWKTAAGGGAFAAVAAVTLAGVWAFRGGLASNADASLAECRAENMRWETLTEHVGETSRITLSIGLRDPDWYEGVLRAVQLSDRKVDSPCLLARDATVQLMEMGPLSDWPGDDPAPIVATAPIEAPGSPAAVPLAATLRRGPATAILVVDLANWCGESKAIGVRIGIPVEAATGVPSHYQGMSMAFAGVPACTDAGLPARLTATALDAP